MAQAHITIITLNCGSIKKLATPIGLTEEFGKFILALAPISSKILCLQELHQENQAELFEALLHGMSAAHFAHIRTTKPDPESKDYGTSLFVTKNLKPLTGSYWISKRTIALDITSKTSHRRLTVITSYFPFGIQHVSDVKQLFDYTLLKSSADNSIVLAGDLNTPIRYKPAGNHQQARSWAGLAQLSDLHRVITPQPRQTSKSPGGTAQGYLCSQRLLLHAISTFTTYPAFNLSNHHIAISITIPLSSLVANPTPSPRPLLSRRTPLPDLGSELELAMDYNDLIMKLQDNTRPPLIPKRPRKSRGATYLNYLKTAVTRTQHRQHKWKLTNPKAIIRLILGHTTQSLALPPHANALWAATLQQTQWTSLPTTATDISALLQLLPKLSQAAISLIMAPITSSDLIKARSRLRHKTTFNDYTVLTLNQLGPRALALLSTECTRWLTSAPSYTQSIIGIVKPTAQQQDPTASDDSLKSWLAQSLRPIGITPAILALFLSVTASRLGEPICIPSIVCPATIGFMPNRSTHHIIIRVIMSIWLAYVQNKPLFILKSDVSKAYDKASHMLQQMVMTHIGLDTLGSSQVTATKEAKIEIQATGDNPHTTQQDCGFIQGHSDVCKLFPLCIDPAVRKLHQSCKPNTLLDHTNQWADDNITVTSDLTTGLARLLQYKRDLEKLGFTLTKIEIAGNERATFFSKTATFDGCQFHISKTIRILGACVHLTQTAAPCSMHRCTQCGKSSPFPLCTECETALIDGLRHWGGTIQERSALYSQQILPSLLYAPYTCTQQQSWASHLHHRICLDIKETLRSVYTDTLPLPLKEGGIGLQPLRDLITTVTVRTLTRETAPVCEAAASSLDIIDELTHNTIVNWPPSIKEGLGSFDIRNHRTAHLTTSSQQAQTHCIANVTSFERSRKTQQCTLNAFFNSNTTLAMSPISWSAHYDSNPSTNKHATLIRMYAILVRHMQQSHTKITINTPAADKLSQHINAYLALTPRQAVAQPLHGCLTTLTQHTVRIVDHADIRTQSTPSPLQAHHCWLHELRLTTYPQLACTNTETAMTAETNNIHFIKEQLLTKYRGNIRNRNQVAAVLEGREPNWIYSGLILYKKRYGVHITTALTHHYTQYLLQLRYGGAIKTNVTTCNCGVAASILHLFSHIPQDERSALELQAHSIHFTSSLSKLHGPTPWLQFTPLTGLGWITHNLSHLDRDKNHKRHQATIRKCLALFATAMIATSIKLLTSPQQLHTVTPRRHPPPEAIDPDETTITSSGWAMATDGAYNPIVPQTMGLGVVFFYNGNMHTQLAINMTHANASSLMAEFYAHLKGLQWIKDHTHILATTTLSPTPCHTYADCQAIHESTHGSWHCSDLNILQIIQDIRDAEQALRPSIVLHRHWIPRAENSLADHQATIGLKKTN